MKQTKLTKPFPRYVIMGVLLAVIVIGAVFLWGSKGKDESASATQAISTLPEVQEFRGEVERGGRSTFSVEIGAAPTGDEPYYTVQVFEIFPDHRSTFGWYRYDPKTGSIYRNNIVTDSWELVK